MILQNTKSYPSPSNLHPAYSVTMADDSSSCTGSIPTKDGSYVPTPSSNLSEEKEVDGLDSSTSTTENDGDGANTEVKSDEEEDSSGDDDVEIPSSRKSNIVLCPAEQYFAHKNQSVKSLVVMCRGLLSGDDQLLDITKEPWLSMKVGLVKPTAKDYKDEIERRWKATTSVSPTKIQSMAPRPKQWLMPRVLEWLDANPVSDKFDVQFLQRRIEIQKGMVERAAKARKMAIDLLEKPWCGKYPYLRLIHALVDHDDCKRLFLTRYDLANDRLQVENRNSITKRATTVWEIVSGWVCLQQLRKNAKINSLQ